MFIVTLYCHDRDATLDEAGFEKWADALAYAIKKAKRMQVNTSIRISDGI